MSGPGGLGLGPLGQMPLGGAQQFDYYCAVNAIYNVLSAHNTMTASPDLSANLTTRVKHVYRNDPAIIALRGDIYPAVFVRVNHKTEEFDGIGTSQPYGVASQATVSYDVIGFYRKDGGHGSQNQVLVEIENLASNIEGVFQAESTLSGTALWCQVARTEFLGPFAKDEGHIKAVLCHLEARYFFL